MLRKYCDGCQRLTGHKRSLGFGTFIMVLLTFGLWILTLPLYPKRCVICGTMNSGWSAPKYQTQLREKVVPIQQIWIEKPDGTLEAKMATKPMFNDEITVQDQGIDGDAAGQMVGLVCIMVGGVVGYSLGGIFLAIVLAVGGWFMYTKLLYRKD